MTLVSTEAAAPPPPPPTKRVWWLALAPLLVVPILSVTLLNQLVGIADVQFVAVAFLVAAAGTLLIAPRGMTAARTWVVGYLVVQFPVRALFLLTAPRERPPLYADVSPGVGLEPALRQALLQSLVGLGVLTVAYLLGRPRTRTYTPLVTGASLRLTHVYVLLGVAVLFLPLEASSASSSAAGGGFLLSLPGLAASGASAAVCYVFVVAPRRHLIPALLALAYTATRVTLLHSKLALLASVVAIVLGLTARERERRPGRSVTARGLALLLVAGLAALYVFAVSSGRNRGQDFTGSLGQGGSAIISRSYGADALVASNQFVDSGGQLLHGGTFLEIAYSWVPRLLWPDKPRSFSIRFGEDVFSFSHSVGSEFFAPSYSGEWLLNFGPVGLLVGWSLFGVALARVDAVPSMAHRSLWLVSIVHLVEGSVVAQLWLAGPFVLGGYWVLERAHQD